MGATSITGVSGQGTSDKATTNALSIWANGPQIYICGVAISEELLASSPPTAGGSVTFPSLPSDSSKYVVILTTLNGGSAYVTDMNETNGKFSGFAFSTEFECDVMFIVVDKGIRGTIPS